MFYPTTDQYLTHLKQKYYNLPDVNRLANFIIENRKQIKFRIQDKKAIFYSNKSLAQELINYFWNYWYDATEVHKNARTLKKNQTICKRIPWKISHLHLKKTHIQHLEDKDLKALWNILRNNENNCLVSPRYVYDFLSWQD